MSNETLELANQIIETASSKANAEPVDSETRRALVELTTCAKAHAGYSVRKLDTSVTADVQSWTAVRLWAEAAKASINSRRAGS
jgi:non-homologous end joining protein Ku